MSTPAIRDVEARITDELAKMRVGPPAAFDVTALRWLALAPEWTDTLARAAHFPTGEEGIEDFARRAENAQLCQVNINTNSALEAKIRFQMRDDVRRELIAQWIEQGIDVRSDAIEVANAIADAASKGVDVALGVKRWASLTLDELDDSQPTGDALTDRIEMLVNEGELAETPTWLYAGEALEAPLGAEMSWAVRRAKRRLRLYDRSEHDQALLVNFLHRERQLDALDRLIKGDPELWALHFMGGGGVGKTMLLRFLTGPYARDYNALAAARIDFDHVDPRYPTEHPAALIEELTDGLSIYAEDRTRESYLRSLRTAIDRANTVAKGSPPTGDPLGPMHTHEFLQTISAFIDFLNSFKTPVLLILDTCEELAKLHPPGENVPSIDATFELIERVHEQAADVRVVFAGRRPLTPHAADWSIDEEKPQPPSVMSLERRPYLMVEEIHGFDREEARKYLRDVRGLAPDDALFDAILRASSESAPGDRADEDTDRELFNPFDLARYADWIEDEPNLSAEQLATKDEHSDPYVMVRIIGRLRSEPDMFEALPFVTVLGSFDAALLHELLRGDRELSSQTVMALAEQEWITLHGGSSIADMTLAVEPRILHKLRRYFQHAERVQKLEAAARTLRPILRNAIWEEDLSSLTAEKVDAAVRLLPADQAAEGFDALASRVAAAQAWAWAESVCGRLLAVDRDEQLPDAVQAAIGALFASALFHRGSTFNGASMWSEVDRQAARHPDRAAAELLHARAALNRISALLESGASTKPGEEASATELRHALGNSALDTGDALTPARLRVAEATLDMAETYGDKAMSDHVAAIVEHLDANAIGDPTLAAFAHMSLGRAHAYAGLLEGARELLRRASQVEIGQSLPAPQIYADWRVPASPKSRLMLERLRHDLAATREPARLLDRCQSAALESPPRTADDERLLSLVLSARLAQRRLDSGLLEQVRILEQGLAPPHATAPAHRAVPPLFVSVAEAMLADGRAGEALHLLTEREAAAVAARDEETVQESAKAILKLLLRLRLDERLGQARELTVSEREDIRAEALAASALIAGDEPRLTSTVAATHSQWRVWTPRHQGQVFKWIEAMERTTPYSTPEGRVVGALDRVELALVQRRWKIPVQLDTSLMRAERAIEDLIRLRRARPNPQDPLRLEMSRITLRANALGVNSQLKLDETRRRRAIGELALEEGELLALRLPEVALSLLELGEQRLSQADDRAGAFVASLRRAIAQIQAGDDQAARESRAAVGQRRADARHLMAPPRRNPSEPALDPWRGWQERLVAYLSWYDGNREDRWYGPIVELQMKSMPGTSLSRGGAFRRILNMQVASGPHILRAILSASVLSAAILALGAPITIAAVGGVLGFALTALNAIPGTQILARATRAVTLDISISPAPDRERGDEQVLVTMLPSAPRWLPRRLVSRLWRASELDQPTAMSLDEEPFRTLPDRLALALGARATLSGRNLRLAVTPDVATQPWEARLIGRRPLSRAGWSPRASPSLWRRAASHRPRNSDGWESGEIAVVASPEMQPFVRHALNTTPTTIRSIGEEGLQGSRRARAVFLVGTPIATGSGWRLRLNSELASEPEAIASSHESRGETFVSPEEGCAIAPFVIVQAPPGGEMTVLDRRTSDGLRGFANEAAASAGFAVLAVPSLPSPLAQEVMEACEWELIKKWRQPPSTRALTNLVTKLRSLVFESGGKPHEDDTSARSVRAQVAYDICLYIPDLRR